MQKNIFYKIILFCFILFIIFFIVDYTIFSIIKKHTKENITYNIYRKNFSYKEFSNNQHFRNEIKTDSNKKSIIIFGEGIAEGLGLEDNQTFANKLSIATKRTIYNRALAGTYIQHAILQIESEKIDNIIKESEYAILFVPSMADNWRLKTYPGPILSSDSLCNINTYPIYTTDTKGNLKLRKQIFPIFSSSITYRLLEKIFIESFSENSDKNIENLKRHILLLNKKLKGKNPNIKLIIIIYYQNKDELEHIINTPEIKFYSVYEFLPDLMENKLYENEMNHPSELLWDKVTYDFVKNLKI